MRRLRPSVIVIALVGALGACGGDDPSGPAPKGFTIGIGPTANVMGGSANSLQLSITRVNGFTGNVKLSVENVPAGLEVVLPPAVSTSRPTVPMYVVANFGVSGPKTFTVRASADGRADETAEASVVVSGEAERRYTMQLALTQVELLRGLTQGIVMSIGRSPGFTTPVPFECANVPEGVNIDTQTLAGAFENPVTGLGARVVISVSPAVFATTYFLRCFGLVTDVAVEHVDLRLVVTPPPILPSRPADRKE